jgi:release factor glutamine methyltransferase
MYPFSFFPPTVARSINAFLLPETLYIPAEDSYLLAETVGEYYGKKALEVGIGSGVVTKSLCKNFNLVVGTDLHPGSINYVKHYIPKNTLLICCNMSDPLRSKFDLIVSNPPYLSNFSEDSKHDTATDGGPTGIEWSIGFLERSVSLLEDTGQILILLSSLSDLSKLDRIVRLLKLRRKVISQRKTFYEVLQVSQISKE